ncbi:MAG: surface-adhesin E family protein [Thermodesulfobacteriota bacterium]
MLSLKKIHFSTIILFLLAAVFFLALSSCGGSDESSDDGWKYVGDIRDDKGEYVQVFIDLDDMSIEGDIRKFWIRYYAPISGTEQKYIRQIGLWEVDCRDRKLFVLAEEYYDVEGKLMGKMEERKHEDYNESSLGGKLTAAACRYAGRN